MQVLRLGGGLRERADVSKHGELAAAEKRLQPGKLRMQAQGHASGFCDDGQKSILRNGEIGSYGGIVQVACRVVGHDHIVAVVAAEKKDADERAIVGGAAPQRRGSYSSDRGADKAERGRGAATDPDKIPARDPFFASHDYTPAANAARSLVPHLILRRGADQIDGRLRLL